MGEFGPEEIEAAFSAAGVSGLPAGAYGQFASYLWVLTRWNQRLNLTSVRESEEIVQRHFIECSFAAQQLPGDIATLLDFGSGAGFPGLPIAICCPDVQVTLAEGHGKKASFLREALRVLELSAEVVEGRVEVMPAERHFNAVTLRAVERMEAAIPIAAMHVTKYLVLLSTEQSVAGLRASVPEFRWRPSIAIPTSTQRVVAIGER